MNTVDFTDESALVADIINKSIRATVNLWVDGGETFWRSTEHRDRDKDDPKKDKFFPTVTFCCLEALAEFRTTFPDWHVSPELDQKLSEVLNSGKATITRMNFDRIKEKSTMTEEGKLSPFTVSRYVHALTAVRNLDDTLGSEISESTRLVAKIFTEKTGKKSWIETNVINHSSNSHPFIIYHMSRACDSCSALTRDNAELQLLLNEDFEMMISHTRNTAKQLLALNATGMLNASDAVALAFCAATLSLSKNTMDHRFIVPALRICFERQDSSGCWPLGRVVSKNKDLDKGKLEISTYELAWTLSALVDCCLELDKGRTSMLSTEDAYNFLKYLIRAAHYAQSTSISVPREDPELEGWCTDHPFGSEMVESWTTASVLQFAVKLSSLIDRITGMRALEKFKSVAYPWDENWPAWLKWKKHIDTFEPDTEHSIVKYINDKIIAVIKKSPRQLPSAKQNSVSALLFGPPGTQKTSIAKAVSDGLGWPIVLLSPGDFIEKGLDAIAAQSSEVFAHLHKLSRVVVLFDECDELFRMREPQKGSEQTRGIAAFVTATMLPNIQDLHDKGRVVFFICTNQFSTMDKALTRGGRVDHVIAVGPPDREARYRFILDSVKDRRISINEDVLRELASATDRFTIPELKRSVQSMIESLTGAVEKDIMKDIMIVHAIADSVKESLTISEDEYKQFTKDRDKYSHPHLERRPENGRK